MNQSQNVEKEEEVVSMSILDILKMIKRSFWIPIAGFFLFTAIGVVYHRNFVPPVVVHDEFVRRAEFHTPNNTQTFDSMITAITHEQVLVATITRLRADNPGDPFFNFFTTTHLREAMIVSMNPNITANFLLRSNHIDDIEAGIARSVIPVAYEQQILLVLVEEIITFGRTLISALHNMQVFQPQAGSALHPRWTREVVDVPFSIPLWMIALAGIAVGGLIALGKEFFSDEIREIESIEKLHKVKIIGYVPT